MTKYRRTGEAGCDQGQQKSTHSATIQKSGKVIAKIEMTLSYPLFSVTRRSRSDESHLLTYLLTHLLTYLLTYLLSVSIDFTDVTLVSEDTC